jgi:hypothetical protein
VVEAVIFSSLVYFEMFTMKFNRYVLIPIRILEFGTMQISVVRGIIQRKTWCTGLMPELTITSPYVYSRAGSNTITMDNHMPESTLSPSQGLWIWPLLSS